MAKSKDDLFDDVDNRKDDKASKKTKGQARREIDELLEKQPVGCEESEEDYLDHYYDFGDMDDIEESK